MTKEILKIYTILKYTEIIVITFRIKIGVFGIEKLIYLKNSKRSTVWPVRPQTKNNDQAV